MDEEQHVVGHQPAQRQHLGCEEVGACQQVHVGPDEGGPRGRPLALGRWRQAVTPQYIADRLIGNLVPQIGQRSGDPVVAPAPVLAGDPTKPGPYIYRIRVPTAYRIPPHKFPDDRVVTILKGIWWTGTGDRYDPFKMDEYNVGTFYVTKAGTPHFDFARTEVILQVMGFGPIDSPVEYLNPDEDPRN